MPIFMLTNVVLDLKGFSVLVSRANYPLHGYLHTFLLAVTVGFVVAGVLLVSEGIFQPV